MRLLLSEAPKWVVKAGVDYVNDEYENQDLVTIHEKKEDIVIEWPECDEWNPTTVARSQGIEELDSTNIELQSTKGTADEFKKELEKRD